MNQIPNIEEVEWKDGMIVEFYAYEMHLNEGGSEEWDNELSIFQRGIVLGDEVVGCDHELSKSDFINGVYIDGIDAGGGYHADKYMIAVLVKPDWLVTLEKTHHHLLQKVREEALAREKQLKQVHMMELDAISCKSIEEFVLWRDHRKQRPKQAELNQDPVHDFFTAPEEVQRPVYERALQKAQEEQGKITNNQTL